MQTVLLRQWQTASLLLLVLGFALGAAGLPNSFLPTLPLDWLLLTAPVAASAVSMHLGRQRLAAFWGILGACAGALLFWSMLYAAASGLAVAGLTTATLETGLFAALLIGATGTISSAVGALWQLPDTPRHRALSRQRVIRQVIGSGLEH